MGPRTLWRLAPLSLALASALFMPVPASAQARSSIEDRLQRLERQLDSNAMLDLVERVDRLQRELRELRGETEQQADAVADLNRRQKELFLDLDRRLKAIEPATAGAGASPAAPPAQAGARPPAAGAPAGPAAGPTPGPAAPPGAAATAPAAGDPLKEQAAYQQAFNLLKEGRYEQATKGFNDFLKSYPKGRYADNAQYWLGESYYVNRQLQPALAEFNKLVREFPESAKVSHAKLKIGLIYSESGELEQAKKVLTEVATKYPNTPQARLAQERLQKLKQD